MLKLSTRGRYGVRLMIDLAQYSGEGPVSLSDVAKRQDISEKYLEHLIVPLKKAGLVRASRGAHGGYVLLRPPGQITFKEIVTAVEGPVCVVDCTRKPALCKRSKNCLTREVWKELAEIISGVLSSLTLQKFIKKESLSGEALCYDI
jgi:Rrf2 family protein